MQKQLRIDWNRVEQAIFGKKEQDLDKFDVFERNSYCKWIGSRLAKDHIEGINNDDFKWHYEQIEALPQSWRSTITASRDYFRSSAPLYEVDKSRYKLDFECFDVEKIEDLPGDLGLVPGEIHCLIGGTGLGKTGLMIKQVKRGSPTMVIDGSASRLEQRIGRDPNTYEDWRQFKPDDVFPFGKNIISTIYSLHKLPDKFHYGTLQIDEIQELFSRFATFKGNATDLKRIDQWYKLKSLFLHSDSVLLSGSHLDPYVISYLKKLNKKVKVWHLPGTSLKGLDLKVAENSQEFWSFLDKQYKNKQFPLLLQTENKPEKVDQITRVMADRYSDFRWVGIHSKNYEQYKDFLIELGDPERTNNVCVVSSPSLAIGSNFINSFKTNFVQANTSTKQMSDFALKQALHRERDRSCMRGIQISKGGKLLENVEHFGKDPFEISIFERKLENTSIFNPYTQEYQEPVAADLDQCERYYTSEKWKGTNWRKQAIEYLRSKEEMNVERIQVPGGYKVPKSRIASWESQVLSAPITTELGDENASASKEKAMRAKQLGIDPKDYSEAHSKMWNSIPGGYLVCRKWFLDLLKFDEPRTMYKDQEAIVQLKPVAETIMQLIMENGEMFEIPEHRLRTDKRIKNLIKQQDNINGWLKVVGKHEAVFDEDLEGRNLLKWLSKLFSSFGISAQLLTVSETEKKEHTANREDIIYKWTKPLGRKNYYGGATYEIPGVVKFIRSRVGDIKFKKGTGIKKAFDELMSEIPINYENDSYYLGTEPISILDLRKFNSASLNWSNLREFGGTRKLSIQVSQDIFNQIKNIGVAKC